MELREILRELLAEKGESQKWLADQIGVTEATISRTLNGINMPGADLLLKMGEALNVSCDYLLGRTPDPSTRTEKENQEYVIGRAFMRCDSRDRRLVLTILEEYLTGPESDLIYKQR